MTHPNEDVIRRGYEAFSTGDLATLGELFSDDVVWHAPGHNLLSGDFHGKDAIFANFQKVAELTGGSFRIDIHALLADDEHAVVLTHATGQREGKTLDDNTVQVFHVKDGKVTEQWLYPGDADATDAFWS
jgi:uncharacterized protein